MNGYAPSTGNLVLDTRLAHDALDELERRATCLSYADVKRLEFLTARLIGAIEIECDVMRASWLGMTATVDGRSQY